MPSSVGPLTIPNMSELSSLGMTRLQLTTSGPPYPDRMSGRTLFEKVWENHLVRHVPGEPDLLYVDLHLVHEVTSPQAFDSLRMQGGTVRRPDLTLATIDHGVPTANRHLGITDPMSKIQIDALVRNCQEFGVNTLRPRRSAVGHRAHHRTRTRPYPAGDAHRVRRFAHLDSRGVGRARLRHWHLRGRARSRHPDPAPGRPNSMAINSRR